MRIRKRLRRLEQRAWAAPVGCLRARYGRGTTCGWERQASKGEIRGQIIRPAGVGEDKWFGFDAGASVRGGVRQARYVEDVPASITTATRTS
jgi:hypothetical protein